MKESNSNAVTVPPSFITMFDEAQKQLARQFNSFASLRKYAETIMGVASVIVSFFATFKVFDPAVVKSNNFYTLFVWIVILYSLLMILSIIVATPSFIESPIKADIDNYNDAYADKNEKEIIGRQIALYVRAIKKNEVNLTWRSLMSNIIGFFLCVIVILVLCATGSLLIK
ncbi:MAG: hypothetical protein WA821_09370 [Anaerolineales bacterium]